MSQASEARRAAPLLRVREFTVTNFRTFLGPVNIPLWDKEEAAHSLVDKDPPDVDEFVARSFALTDRLAIFHGDNGAGKSNAIAALRLFFALALLWLRGPKNVGTDAYARDGDDVTLGWDRLVTLPGLPAVMFSARDRPPEAQGPSTIEVSFADPRIPPGTLSLSPSGNRVRVRLDWKILGQKNHDQILTWVEAPLGPASQPIAVLNARRSLSAVTEEAVPSLLSPHLAERLYQLRTSLYPAQRDRWRVFAALLAHFPTLTGKEITIERIQPDAAPVLLMEERGRNVLRLDELSSGEQQLIVLSAAVLLADAAIIVIEEPELSLDSKNQARLLALLRQQLDAGVVDQFILESHVPAFDGPSVVRFQRSGQVTTVSREASRSAAQVQLQRQAKERGALPRWVTQDGYTQLPEQMVEELVPTGGAHLWFLKDDGRWQAWPEDELTKLLSSTSEDVDDT